MEWKTPGYTIVNMDTEIGRYQDDLEDQLDQKPGRFARMGPED
jgi:hypothetical protein